MKQIFLAITAATFVAVNAPGAHAAKVSVDFFYDALDPHGEWIEAADYGYVWQPRDVGSDWRPYTDGNWAYTDAGWTWVSEEPFGWATYHYGRWAEIDRTGWVWVPDTTWGPAWVSWRRSKTHVGWAPLPPEARFEARSGFHGWVDSYYDIGPTNYSFVKVRDFGEPRLRTVVLSPRENITIINQTTNITNITYADNVVINNGPEYDVIVRESAQPVRRLKLERRTEIDTNVRTAKFNAEVTGQSLRVVAPEIESGAATSVKPKTVARKLDRVAVNRGWRDAGNAQQVKELRAKVAAETKVPEGMPPKPQLRGTDTEAAAPDAAKPAVGTAAAEGQAKTPRAAAPGTLPPPETNKPAATAQKPAEPREDATAQQPDAKRPGVAAQEKRDQRREDRPGVAKKNPGESEPASIAEDPAGRPERQRPGAKEDAKPDGARPPSQPGQPDRPQTRPQQSPGSRAADELAPTRPGTERPDSSRPDAGRPERPSPQAERPERRAPAEQPQRSPERARPEAADRSLQSRPPAATPAAKDKDDANKKEKKEPELL